MPPWADIAAASGIVIRTPANQVIGVEQCTYAPHNASLRFRREPLTPSSTLPGIRCAMTRSKYAVTVQVQPQRRRVGIYVNAALQNYKSTIVVPCRKKIITRSNTSSYFNTCNGLLINCQNLKYEEHILFAAKLSVGITAFARTPSESSLGVLKCFKIALIRCCDRRV
jgi:hypothetical protein